MSIKDVIKVQEEKLFRILNKNKNSVYGKKYKFGEIDSVEEFRAKLPITTYEDYAEYIDRIKKGEKQILTEEKVIMFEPTSGSTAATKLIPYTKSLKEEFQCGIKSWIYSLYNDYKGLKYGKSYWSVTPALSKKGVTECGIPVGFEEDSEYLGGAGKKLIEYLFAVPSRVSKIEDIDEFYMETVCTLLMCKELKLISVWHPTYLILMVEFIKKNREKVLEKIKLEDFKRAGETENALNSGDYSKVWKNLKVISCWCDGNSMDYISQLKEIFKGVEIQPKGLISTEGFITFPLKGRDGAVLSVYSHFFEFFSLKDEKVYTATELKKGEEYIVIITTSGGFYRYNTNDIVEVTGFERGIALLKFKGKNDLVSDYFGEKISEQFIKEVMKSYGVKDEFYMVAFEVNRYVFYIEGEIEAEGIDEKLRENFHYDYCRKLGQLEKAEIFRLRGNPEKEYIEFCISKGQRMGDIKINRLSRFSGLENFFKGEYI